MPSPSLCPHCGGSTLENMSCISQECVPDDEQETVSNLPKAGTKSGDYYVEGGFLVFTAQHHLKRGYCCGNGCRHCPYPKADS